MKGSVLLSVLVLVFLLGAAIAGPGEEADTLKAVPEKDASAQKLDMKIVEIFGKSCATSSCHGGEHPKMNLSLEADDIPANMLGVPSRQNGKLMLIDTRDPSQSYLLLKMTGGEGMKGKKMPIMKAPLTEDEKTAVMTWIRGFAGAEQVEEPVEKETDEENDG